jgi:hypothetical protein
MRLKAGWRLEIIWPQMKIRLEIFRWRLTFEATRAILQCWID